MCISGRTDQFRHIPNSRLYDYIRNEISNIVTEEHTTINLRKGTKHTPESREKMSKAKKGKPLSKEHRESLSKAKQNILSKVPYNMRVVPIKKRKPVEPKKRVRDQNLDEKNGFYGKKHTAETITTMQINSGTKKPVIIENKKYISIADAARKLNLTRAIVSDRIKSKNDHWRLWNFL